MYFVSHADTGLGQRCVYGMIDPMIFPASQPQPQLLIPPCRGKGMHTFLITVWVFFLQLQLVIPPCRGKGMHFSNYSICSNKELFIAHETSNMAVIYMPNLTTKSINRIIYILSTCLLWRNIQPFFQLLSQIKLVIRYYYPCPHHRDGQGLLAIFYMAVSSCIVNSAVTFSVAVCQQEKQCVIFFLPCMWSDKC